MLKSFDSMEYCAIINIHRGTIFVNILSSHKLISPCDEYWNPVLIKIYINMQMKEMAYYIDLKKIKNNEKWPSQI